MKQKTSARSRTRNAILEALADVITESHGTGFSVQAVADRAGVTHRTVYNHFPTREALCDAFYEYVDELLLSTGQTTPSALARQPLPDLVSTLYRALEHRDRYVRASVILMIANRRALKSWRSRTKAIEKRIAREAPDAPLPPPQLTAAVRMFASSMGWHLLTEQYGLSADEAVATGVWATGTLLAAASRGATLPRASRPDGKAARRNTNPKKRGTAR